MELQTTFLDAIQAIPGATPGEKFRYISKLVQNSIKNGENVEKLIKSHQLPHVFQPLYEIEAAKILKNNEKVVEALKSEDSLILNRAFSASMFFDGSDKRIVNVKYFKENILPYVSLNTRLRIIKGLAIHLGSKQPKLAEEFFTMFAELYGIDQAMPLLTACDENFTYNTIVEKKIVLSRKLMKILYRKNPNLVIRYLKLATSKSRLDERTPHAINLRDYTDFLSKLIKKNLRAFVEIFEACEKNPPSIHLSNKLAAVFLKNGKQYLIDKPHLYFSLLPLNIIDPQTMKIIFPKLMPREKNDFDTNTMLGHLKHYPEKEKLRLLMETYEQCYGRSILDDTNNVTPELLLILPTKERIEQARVKLQKEEEGASRTFTFQKVWRCYLPTNEIIPVMKEEISKTATMEDRMRLLVQMMYCCKVNQDDETLVDVLKYFQTRHKNEQSWLITSFLNNFLHEYDFQKLSEDHWHIINDIIRRSYVKGVFQPGSTTTKLLTQSIQYKLTHNIPIEQSIEMFVEFRAFRYEGDTWNILTKFPEYEKKCLTTYVEVLLKKYVEPPTTHPWTSAYGILHDILASIIDYHNRHLKGVEVSTTLNGMKYPELLERILTTMKLLESEEEQDNNYSLRELKDLLQKSDKNLYALWFKEKPQSEIAKISSGEAISLLRKNPHDIMEHWEEYLKECENRSTNTNVTRFVKAIRWYKDIPIKWSIQCQKDLTEKKNRNALRILGILLDGQSFTILINPLIPKETSIETNSEEAKENHNLIASIPRVVNIVNPPPPLEVVGEFCKGDYLSAGLAALTNVCRRSSVAKVLPFAKTLANQRVSVRKHGMRLMYMVANVEEICDYFLSQWKTEEHYSIRSVLVNKIYDLFTHHPTSATWNLLEHCISTLTVDDIDSLSDVIKLRAIPNEYIVNYVKLLSKTINNLEKLGLEHDRMAQEIRSLLHNVDPITCNLLPDELCMGWIEKFLFDTNSDIFRSAKHFTLDSFLSDESKIKSRLDLFSKLFIDVVKARWNEPHPKKSRFCPVNYVVHDFIDDLVQSYLHGRESEMYLIDNMLKTFQTVVNPRMDARSFLLLLYAKEKYQSKSLKDFGTRIGRKAQELINIYSEFFISFMTDTLQYFFKSSLFFGIQDDEVSMSVIEGLVEVKSHCTHFMAAQLLSPVTDQDYVDRYDHLIRVLVEDKQSDITSIICNTINSVSYQACISDC